MVNRLINIPLSTSDFDTELNYIYNIAVNNGYERVTIDNILAKKRQEKTMTLIYPRVKDNTPKTFSCLTYIGIHSIKTKKALQKINNNIQVAFKTNFSLGQHIKNNKDNIEKKSNSGVYMLTCNDCPRVYVEQTGRSFDDRLKEHHRSFRLRNNNSTYANHLLENNHNFNPDFKILHVQNKSRKLNLLECLEINKYNKLGLLLNDQTEVNNSPLLNITFHNS